MSETQALNALGWIAPSGLLGPSLDGGPVVIEVVCRTSPVGRGRAHEVSVSEHWEVTTPHDLESERIGVAMGGYLSCVELVDQVIPAVRDVVQMRARTLLPPVARDPRSKTWSVHPAPGCECLRGPFSSSLAAVRHLRSPSHWRRAHDANDRMFTRVFEQIDDNLAGPFRPRPTERVRRMVVEPDGFRELWELGIPPEFIELVHHQVCRGRGSLPRRVYEAVAFLAADTEWLREVLDDTSDKDAVLWAAGSEHIWGDRFRDSRVGWLRTGVPRSMLEVLIPSAYSLADVVTTARDFRCTEARAAGILAGWVAVGVQPTERELALLSEVPMAGFVPSRRSVESLLEQVKRARLGRAERRPTYDQAALLLAAVGTVSGALTLIKRGVLTVEEAVASLRPRLPTTGEPQLAVEPHEESA